MPSDIILIGPIGAGKSTLGELLSVRLGQPQCSMDDRRWDYYKEIGYDEAIAPNHKQLKMVAHGLGRWWIGPGLNDFDKHLIQACRNRKRKFQQPDSESDAKTFINNMLRNEDWGNLSLRCEEAIALRERAAVTPIARIAEPMVSGRNSPFERSLEERRESALGLARFKVTQGQIEQALTISKQFGLSTAEIGIANRRPTDTYACAA